MSWMLGIIVIVFLIVMAIYWSTQGLFSAILHLGMVIAAGALALTVWEPLAVWVLLDRMPSYAWGVGLLAPFAFFLIALRIISDKLIAGNLQFSSLTNTIGGACVGAIAGVLTSGLILIGLGFLPLSPSILGYQPYGFGNDGQVQAVTGAFMPVPVVTKTAAFYNALALAPGITGGAFSTSTPLAEYVPDLAKQSALYRMASDPNASLVATPASVSVSAAYRTTGAKLKLASDARNIVNVYQPKQQLVVVDTTWHMILGVFDGDKTLRLTSAQVRLITRSTTKHGQVRVHLVEPIAYSRLTNKRTGARELVPFDQDNFAAYAFNDNAVLGWIFRLPQGEQPWFLEVRHLRLSLPSKFEKGTGAIAKAVGHPRKQPKKPRGPKGPSVGRRQGLRVGNVAQSIRQTNKIKIPFRKSMAPNLQYKGHSVVSGKDVTKVSYGGIGQRTVVRSIYTPEQKAMVRLKVTADQVQSFFGRAMAFAATVNPPLLKDDHGDEILPSAYVWVKNHGKNEEINVPFASFQSAKQIPFDKMKPGDEMYLYFLVNHGVTITSYQLSRAMHQNIHLKIPGTEP